MDLKLNLSFDALRNPRYRGKKYVKVKSFTHFLCFGKHARKRAEDLAEQLEEQAPSKRYPPIVYQVPIGLKLGNIYKVCKPKFV